MVEEVSVLVADKRRKDPRSIPRPWEKNKPKASFTRTSDGAIKAVGLQGMLTATQMRGAVALG